MRSSRRRCGRSGWRRISGAVVALAAVISPAGAVDLGGSARLTWTETEADSAQVTSTDHAANLSLSQVLSPYLTMRFTGSFAEQNVALEGDDVSSRSTQRPLAELLYRRPSLSWRLGWETRRVDSMSELEEVDSNALTGTLSWTPRADFRLSMGFRDSRDTADVAALGRDLDERRGNVDALYQRPFWSLGYSATYRELAGGLAELDVEQLRQDLRLQASRALAEGRLRLSFSGTAGRLEAREKRGAGALGEPLPAVQGLFAIDPSPTVGELESAPGLSDGDAAAPTSPPIEIGGANTFRNVGLDLGVPRPASRLEIAVDRVSGAQVIWDVYESADGTLWEPVAVVARGFDTGLLRYSLLFVETSQRFLKAVNVSTNPAPEVRVTEVRALRELAGIATDGERDREIYSAGAHAAWRVTPRVGVDASATTSNDETTVGGLTRRDFTTTGLRFGVQVDLSETLRLAAGFRRAEFEEARTGGLTRGSDDLHVNLRWNPLPTADAALSAGTRTDSDESGELSKTDSARLLVSLDLLDELRLITDLGASRLGGPLLGADRDTLSWSQRVEMLPRENWRISAGYTWSRTESAGAEGVLLDRTSTFVDLDWTPGAALSLRGSLYYFDETGGGSLRQSCSLFWAPGPKLNVSLAWDEFDQNNGLLTANDSLSVNYRATGRVLLFASLVRSRTDLGTGAEQEVTSAQAGTHLSF